MKHVRVPVWQTLPSPSRRTFNKHGVIVAIGEPFDDGEPVAGRLALHPQRLPRAGVERGIAGLPGAGEGLVVHEADHQDFVRFGVLDDGRDESVEFAEIHT